MNDHAKTVKVYTDQELTTRFNGRVFTFRKRLYYGQAVYSCDAINDQLTHELCKIPGFTITPPVEFKKEEQSNQDNKSLLLVGSFEKKGSVLGNPYHFKKDTQGIYIFNIALIPEHHATIMVTASPDTFWLIDDVPTWRRAINQQIVNKQVEQEKKLKTSEFTIKTIKEIQKAEAEDEKMDRRNLQEVLFEVFTKDASNHGLDLIPDEEKKEAERKEAKKITKKDELVKKKKEDFFDRIMKENQDDIDNMEKSINKPVDVRVSPVIESVQGLVTPDDLPSLQKDIEKSWSPEKKKKKVEIPPDTTKTDEFTYHKLKELLAKNKFTIEELNFMIEHEKQTDRRTSVVALMRKQIGKIKYNENKKSKKKKKKKGVKK